MGTTRTPVFLLNKSLAKNITKENYFSADKDKQEFCIRHKGVDVMRIENSSAVNQTGNVKPQEPAQPKAPVPPPGGNVEHRQPPQKPSEPKKPERGGKIDIYV
jgi:hypothetical protein